MSGVTATYSRGPVLSCERCNESVSDLALGCDGALCCVACLNSDLHHLAEQLSSLRAERDKHKENANALVIEAQVYKRRYEEMVAERDKLREAAMVMVRKIELCHGKVPTSIILAPGDLKEALKEKTP